VGDREVDDVHVVVVPVGRGRHDGVAVAVAGHGADGGVTGGRGRGGGLAALLFENTEVAAELAKRRLMEAITNYEPRALISDISFTIEDTSIEVSVSFLLNTTGESDEVRAVLSRGN
jgi:hypothetical protein